MEHDFTPTALSDAGHKAKEATRRAPLDAVRADSAFLWDHASGELRRDWMELAGREAPTLALLIAERALVPGGRAKFVGVDASPSVALGCAEHFGPEAPAEWRVGRLESLVSGKGSYPNVGVLVYDTEDGAWRERWGALDRVCTYARRQADSLGEFVLVVNASARFATPADLDRYRARLALTARRDVLPEALHTYRSRDTPMAWTMLTFGF